jgi:hypothetical protein
LAAQSEAGDDQRTEDDDREAEDAGKDTGIRPATQIWPKPMMSSAIGRIPKIAAATIAWRYVPPAPMARKPTHAPYAGRIGASTGGMNVFRRSGQIASSMKCAAPVTGLSSGRSSACWYTYAGEGDDFDAIEALRILTGRRLGHSPARS